MGQIRVVAVASYQCGRRESQELQIGCFPLLLKQEKDLLKRMPSHLGFHRRVRFS
jgi:hypothetical protein